MDIISFNEAATANGRIESFIENPDSTSGIVTVPKTIASGETVTIPAGRVAVLPNVQVDGTLNVEGEVFIPSGATFGDLETTKADISYVNNKYSGFKNYIINGNFDVWQRGISQSTAGYGSADRWFFGVTNGLVGNLNKLEITKINNIKWGGATFRSLINVTTAPNSATSLLEQRMENPFRLSGKTVTVSFYASCASGVGSIIVSLYSNKVKINSNNVDSNIGTFTPTPGIARYSFTYTLPIFDEKTIEASDFLALRFVVPSGFLCTNLGISGVQLEEGSIATPFEQRPYGLELSLCQRYCRFLDGAGHVGHKYGTAGGDREGIQVFFDTPMRTSPTVTLITEGTFNNCTLDDSNVNPSAFAERVTVTTTGQYRHYGFVYKFDAEL